MGIRLSVKSSLSDLKHSEVMYEFPSNKSICIGRSADMDVQLPHPTVSSHHATLHLRDSELWIQDEESTNGTAINGQLLFPGEEKVLSMGDEITVGGFSLIFQKMDDEFSNDFSIEDMAERTRSVAREMLRQVSMVEGKDIEEPRIRILKGKSSGKSFSISKNPQPAIGGRDENSDFFIEDPDVSRAHFEIRRAAEGTIIEDLSSKNGILVNQQKVKTALLLHNDEIQVGETILKYDDPAQVELEKIERGEDEVTNVPITSNQKQIEQKKDFEQRNMEAEERAEQSDASVAFENEGYGSTNGFQNPTDQQIQFQELPRQKSKFQLLQKADFFVLLLVGLVCILSLSGLFILLN